MNATIYAPSGSSINAVVKEYVSSKNINLILFFVDDEVELYHQLFSTNR